MPTESTSSALQQEERPQTSARRVRHEARDAMTAAAVSLAGSVLVAAALWAVTAWLR